MKKFLGYLFLVTFLFSGTAVYSISVGFEPPSQYMYKLKSCTPSVTNRIKYGMVEKYEIKGKLQDGRCQVTITTYQNVTEETYEMQKSFYKSMAKSISGKEVKNFPTREELIREAKKDQDVTVCKFSPEQRTALYNAYLKHDGKNFSTVSNYKNGGTSIKINSKNMSSYDSLMLNYSYGTCSPD